MFRFTLQIDVFFVKNKTIAKMFFARNNQCHYVALKTE